MPADWTPERHVAAKARCEKAASQQRLAAGGFSVMSKRIFVDADLPDALTEIEWLRGLLREARLYDVSDELLARIDAALKGWPK